MILLYNLSLATIISQQKYICRQVGQHRYNMGYYIYYIYIYICIYSVHFIFQGGESSKHIIKSPFQLSWILHVQQIKSNVQRPFESQILTSQSRKVEKTRTSETIRKQLLRHLDSHEFCSSVIPIVHPPGLVVKLPFVAVVEGDTQISSWNKF